MQHSIVTAFVPLAAYILMASAQQPTSSWTNPYFYYPNYNTPLALPTQKVSVDEKSGNQQLFTNYNDHSMQNTLGSHVVLLTTCLRDLKTTKADLVHTHTEVETVKKELKASKAELANTHTAVDGVKKELANVLTVVENLKKEVNAGAASSIGRMPESCNDLQKIGHRKSGFFTVMGNKTVNNVYCDFSKPTHDAGFQKVIGYFDVKTSPVHFHAQRSSTYTLINTAVPFDTLRFNLGGAMSTTGIFVAPKSGRYSFAYSGLSESNTIARIEMQVKTQTADWTRVGQAFGTQGRNSFALQSAMDLAKGDQIRLALLEGSLHDLGTHYFNFVGHLLEEDITH